MHNNNLILSTLELYTKHNLIKLRTLESTKQTTETTSQRIKNNLAQQNNMTTVAFHNYKRYSHLLYEQLSKRTPLLHFWYGQENSTQQREKNTSKQSIFCLEETHHYFNNERIVSSFIWEECNGHCWHRDRGDRDDTVCKWWRIHRGSDQSYRAKYTTKIL